jgi:hypothetical protein
MNVNEHQRNFKVGAGAPGFAIRRACRYQDFFESRFSTDIPRALLIGFAPEDIVAVSLIDARDSYWKIAVGE